MSGQLHALAASSPGKDPGKNLLEGSVDPRAGTDAVAKNKDPFSARAANRNSVIQPVTLSLSYSGFRTVSIRSTNRIS